jgi:hypothetical protein
VGILFMRYFVKRKKKYIYIYIFGLNGYIIFGENTF